MRPQNNLDEPTYTPLVGKDDKKLFLFFAIILLPIVGYYLYREFRLEKDGVYVVGRVTRIVEDDNGYNTTIVYPFDNEAHQFVYKSLPRINDSLVFVYISKGEPGVWKFSIGKKVLYCLKYGDVLEKSQFDSFKCK